MRYAANAAEVDAYWESETSKRVAVTRLLVDVGKSLHAFDYGPHIPFEGRKQYLSRTVDKTMKEAEAAFADADYDRAEHLAKIVAYLVRRETPKFTANPKAWIERWRAMHGYCATCGRENAGAITGMWRDRCCEEGMKAGRKTR